MNGTDGVQVRMQRTWLVKRTAEWETDMDRENLPVPLARVCTPRIDSGLNFTIAISQTPQQSFAGLPLW
ncbi:hypothetical protein [Pedobacter suwonensis]|uniref:hypothetical protein n=1 Tax=Pedobacter suwonensis TaxID=332999 RepID=UPI0011A4C7F4|nr:hypothetical protein [Pedobacter suwonensis]